MKLKDLIHLKGEVLIQAIDTSGKISTLVEDKNLIVSNGRENICNFLTNKNTSSYIYDIFFGSGGTIPGNSNVALPVLPGDLNVISRIAASANIDYTFSALPETTPSPRAVFSIVLPTTPSSLNGQAISEIALMLNTATPKAFAIKRFPSISKSDSVSIIITWIIYV